MALAKSLHDLRDMAADELASFEDAAHSTGELIGRGIGYAAETARHAAERARHVANDVARNSARGIHTVQETISHRPMTAAFVAIGIGFLLAAVSLRRRW